MATHLQFNVFGTPIRTYAQEPSSADTPQAAIVLLHGAGGNIDFWTSRFAPLLQQAGVALYAPHYFDSTQTSYADFATITDGVHAPRWLEVIDAALHFAAGRPGIDPSRVVLAGISLGGFLSLATAARLSASPHAADRRRLKAVIEISGGLVEPYSSEATSSFAPTLILHGAQDNIVPVSHAQTLDRKLTQLDVAHRTEILPNEGHWFSSASLPRMLLAVSSFLQEHIAPSAAASRPL